MYQNGVASINGRIYIFGGIKQTSSSTVKYNYIQEYDPSTDTIVQKGTLPVSGSMRCTIMNDKIYVYSGTTIYEYDPNTNTATLKRSSSVSPYCGVATVNNESYIFYNKLIYKYTLGAYLGENNLKVFGVPYNSETRSTYTDIFNTDSEQVKMTITSAFLGNSDGYAEKKDAYIYNSSTSSWELTS